MGIYVQRSCPKCGTILEGFTRDYRGIGIPFVDCQTCGTVVKLSHINEWDLMHLEGKIIHVLIHIWTNFFLSVSGLILVLLYYELYLDVAISKGERTENSSLIAVASYFITFIILSAIRTHRLRKEIRKSRRRMRDPEYLEKLRRLGYLKGE